MFAANFRGIAHDGGNFVEAFTHHGQMASEGVPEIEAGPIQAGCFVGISDRS